VDDEPDDGGGAVVAELSSVVVVVLVTLWSLQPATTMAVEKSTATTAVRLREFTFYIGNLRGCGWYDRAAAILIDAGVDQNGPLDARPSL
jgi:hypothetical protein